MATKVHVAAAVTSIGLLAGPPGEELPDLVADEQGHPRVHHPRLDELHRRQELVGGLDESRRWPRRYRQGAPRQLWPQRHTGAFDCVPDD